MTINELLDKLSAELVEEIIAESCHPTGTPWFMVVRAKMTALALALKERKKPTYIRTEGLHQ